MPTPKSSYSNILSVTKWVANLPKEEAAATSLDVKTVKENGLFKGFVLSEKQQAKNNDLVTALERHEKKIGRPLTLREKGLFSLDYIENKKQQVVKGKENPGFDNRKFFGACNIIRTAFNKMTDEQFTRESCMQAINQGKSYRMTNPGGSFNMLMRFMNELFNIAEQQAQQEVRPEAQAKPEAQAESEAQAKPEVQPEVTPSSGFSA